MLQGFTSDTRQKLSRAVLEWADQQEDLAKHSITSLEIIEKHKDLEKSCCVAHESERSFASLASKALWLCYPDSVPILDRFVESAVQILTKLDPSIDPTVSESGISTERYKDFVHCWEQLFDRYWVLVDNLPLPVEGDLKLHKPKIFDGILQEIGKPGYKF